MPMGIPFFSFEDFQVFGEGNSRAKAMVKFTFDDELAGGVNVSHVVQVTVRVNTHVGATIEELQQAVFEKAAEQIRRINGICEGKTAQGLVLEAEADVEARRRQNEAENPFVLNLGS